jgi:hypothetical protein
MAWQIGNGEVNDENAETVFRLNFIFFVFPVRLRGTADGSKLQEINW